jgi:hypothetical protein
MDGAGSVFYIATLFNGNNITTDGTHFTAWAQANLGSVNFWVGDLPAVDLANTNTFANICAVNGKPLVCEVQSGSYWSTNSSASQGIYLEHNGGEGSAQEWVHAIGLNPAWVTEAVWNDWTEAYTSPVDIPNVPTVSSGYPYDNLLKPHRGYSEQRKYYAQWYVTGAQPAIAKDLLIYFYRVCPQAANTNPCAGGGNPGPCPPDWRGTIQDVIFIETFLTAPATLSVSTGGNVKLHADQFHSRCATVFSHTRGGHDRHGHRGKHSCQRLAEHRRDNNRICLRGLTVSQSVTGALTWNPGYIVQ